MDRLVHRQKGRVLVSGCFNVLHAGHVELLEYANRYGKVTVGLNADPYLIKKYGEYAVPLVSRTYVLQSNIYVDKVVVFTEENPSELIRRVQPEYYIKGPDYSLELLPEREVCEELGVQIIFHRNQELTSSSSKLVRSLRMD